MNPYAQLFLLLFMFVPVREHDYPRLYDMSKQKRWERRHKCRVDSRVL